MLRVITLALGAALLTASLAIIIATPEAWPTAIYCAVLGFLILVGTLFEKHYRSRRSVTASAWQTTGERFMDPSTGQLTDVRYNPQTGERSYDPSDSTTFPKI